MVSIGSVITAAGDTVRPSAEQEERKESLTGCRVTREGTQRSQQTRHTGDTQRAKDAFNTALQ